MSEVKSRDVGTTFERCGSCFSTRKKVLVPIYLTLSLYSILWLPYSAALLIQYDQGDPIVVSMFIVDLLITIVFILESLCNHNILKGGYLYKSESDTKWIHRTGAKWNLFAFFPWEFIGLAGGVKVCVLLRLSRLHLLLRLPTYVALIVKYLRPYYVVPPLPHSITRLIALLGGAIFFVHFWACLWIFVIYHEGNNIWRLEGCQETASVRRSCDSLADQYLLSLYWSSTTFSTVGFGDIVPHSNTETILTIMVQMIGVNCCALVIAAVTAAIVAKDASLTAHEDKLGHVSKFIKFHNLPTTTSSKILDYYDESWKNFLSCEENLFQNSLPPSLRLDAMSLLAREIFDTHFPDFSMGLLKSIYACLIPKLYPPNCVLLREGAIRTGLSFVLEGIIKRSVTVNVPREEQGEETNKQTSSKHQLRHHSFTSSAARYSSAPSLRFPPPNALRALRSGSHEEKKCEEDKWTQKQMDYDMIESGDIYGLVGLLQWKEHEGKKFSQTYQHLGVEPLRVASNNTEDKKLTPSKEEEPVENGVAALETRVWPGQDSSNEATKDNRHKMSTVNKHRKDESNGDSSEDLISELGGKSEHSADRRSSGTANSILDADTHFSELAHPHSTTLSDHTPTEDGETDSDKNEPSSLRHQQNLFVDVGAECTYHAPETHTTINSELGSDSSVTFIQSPGQVHTPQVNHIMNFAPSLSFASNNSNPKETLQAPRLASCTNIDSLFVSFQDLMPIMIHYRDNYESMLNHARDEQESLYAFRRRVHDRTGVGYQPSFLHYATAALRDAPPSPRAAPTASPTASAAIEMVSLDADPKSASHNQQDDPDVTLQSDPVGRQDHGVNHSDETLPKEEKEEDSVDKPCFKPILPSSRFRALWNISSLILLLYYVFTTTLIVCREYDPLLSDDDKHSHRWHHYTPVILTYSADVFFIVDIFLRLFLFLDHQDRQRTLAALSQGRKSVSTLRKSESYRPSSSGSRSRSLISISKSSSHLSNLEDMDIVITYAQPSYRHKTRFIIDLISIIPLDLIFGIAFPSAYGYLRLPKLLRTLHFSQYFEHVEQYLTSHSSIEINNKVTRIFQRFLQLSLTFWFLAFGFVMIGLSFSEDLESWRERDLNAPHRDMEMTMARAVYFIIVTMTTIGSGDITPLQTLEIVYTLGVQVLGMFMIPLIIGYLTSASNNLDSVKNAYDDDVTMIKHYLKSRYLSTEITTRVAEYYDFLWKRSGGGKEMDYVIQGLPSPLQAEVTRFLYLRHLRHVHLFRGCQRNFLLELSRHIITRIYPPATPVQYAGQTVKAIYIVVHGSLNFQDPAIEENVSDLEDESLNETDEFGDSNVSALDETKASSDLDDLPGVVSTSRLKYKKAKSKKKNLLRRKTSKYSPAARFVSIAAHLPTKVSGSKQRRGGLHNGVNTSLTTLREGQVFGESSLAIFPAARTVSLDVVTGSDYTTLAILDVSQIKQAVFIYPDTWDIMNQNLQQLQDKEKQVHRATAINLRSSKLSKFIELDEPGSGANGVDDGRFYILPNSNSHLIMDLACLIFALYNLATIPFLATFYLDPNVGDTSSAEHSYIILYTLSYLGDAIFMVVFVLRLTCVPYFDQSTGVVVLDPARIRQTYIHSLRFKFDLIALLPLDFFAALDGVETIANYRVNKILQLIRVTSYLRHLQHYFETHESKLITASYLRSVGLVLVIWLVTHLGSCLWYWVTFTGTSFDSFKFEPVSWAHADGIQDSDDSVGYRYLRSYYWSLGTNMVIFAGDIVPMTMEETITMIFVMLIGITFYAGFIANFAALVTNSDTHTVNFYSQLQQVTVFCDQNKAWMDKRSKLKKSILGYYQRILRQKAGIDDRQVYNLLPAFLKRIVVDSLANESIQEVCLGLFGDGPNNDELIQVPSPGFIHHLTDLVMPEFFVPEQLIVHAGDIGMTCYIILEGEVERLEHNHGGGTNTQGSNSSENTLEAGDYFGAEALLKPTKCERDMLALTFVDTLMLSHTDIVQALQLFPEERAELMKRHNLELDEKIPDSVTPEATYEDEKQESLRVKKSLSVLKEEDPLVIQEGGSFFIRSSAPAGINEDKNDDHQASDQHISVKQTNDADEAEQNDAQPNLISPPSFTNDTHNLASLVTPSADLIYDESLEDIDQQEYPGDESVNGVFLGLPFEFETQSTSNPNVDVENDDSSLLALEDHNENKNNTPINISTAPPPPPPPTPEIAPFPSLNHDNDGNNDNNNNNSNNNNNNNNYHSHNHNHHHNNHSNDMTPLFAPILDEDDSDEQARVFLPRQSSKSESHANTPFLPRTSSNLSESPSQTTTFLPRGSKSSTQPATSRSRSGSNASHDPTTPFLFRAGSKGSDDQTGGMTLPRSASNASDSRHSLVDAAADGHDDPSVPSFDQATADITEEKRTDLQDERKQNSSPNFHDFVSSAPARGKKKRASTDAFHSSPDSETPTINRPRRKTRRMSVLHNFKTFQFATHVANRWTEIERMYQTDLAWCMPKSTFRQRWNVVASICLLYNLLTLPLYLCIYQTTPNFPATSFSNANGGEPQVSDIASWFYAALFFELVTDCIFLVDMVFHYHYFVRRQVSNEQNWEYDADERHKFYLREHFKYQLPSTVVPGIPVLIVVCLCAAQVDLDTVVIALRAAFWLRLVRLLRLIDLKSMLTKLEAWIGHSGALVSRIVKVYMFWFFIIHWFACVWFAIGQNSALSLTDDYVAVFSTNNSTLIAAAVAQLDNPRSWMDMLPEATTGPLSRNNFMYWYIRSLYWVTTTMSGTGYGDLTPQNAQETAFSLLVQVMSALLFAIVIGSFTSILNIRSVNRKRFEQQVNDIETWLKRRESMLDAEYRARVRKYMEYVERSNGLCEDCDIVDLATGDENSNSDSSNSDSTKSASGGGSEAIVNDLPHNLRQQVVMARCGILVYNVPLLKGLSPGFLNLLAVTLVPTIYPPGDVVCYYQQVAFEMYFIQEGTIDVFIHIEEEITPSDDSFAIFPDKPEVRVIQKHVKELETNTFFGELGLFLGIPRTTTCKASTRQFCKLLTLNKKSLEQVLRVCDPKIGVELKERVKKLLESTYISKK